MARNAMKRVIITDFTFADVDRETRAASVRGATLEARQCRTAEEVTDLARGADVVVAQFAPVSSAAIEAMAPSATIIRYGIGYDNIDIAAARGRRIQVGYVPDYCLDEVADHAVAMMLHLLRRLGPLDQSVRAGRWEGIAVARPILASGDTTVGFLGLGRIGRGVLRRLKPFGFRFIAADPGLDAAAARKLGVDKVDLGTLFTRADVLSLHAPATPETTRVINAHNLALMRPGAVVVNCARGQLVDEDALAAALRSGALAGAALDVFAVEPLSQGSILREAPNLVLTPHISWYSEAALANLQQLVADDIDRVLSGAPPRVPVPGSYRPGSAG